VSFQVGHDRAHAAVVLIGGGQIEFGHDRGDVGQAARRCRATAFKTSSSAPSRADPRRAEYTTCTTVAPDAVFTFRTHGTRPLYGPD
jgi:hypothetical protein